MKKAEKESEYIHVCILLKHTHSQESAGGVAAQCYANQRLINRIRNYQMEAGSDTHAFKPTHTQSDGSV